MRLLPLLSVVLFCAQLSAQTAPVSQVEGYLEVYHPNSPSSTYVGKNTGQKVTGAGGNSFFGSDAGHENDVGGGNSFFGDGAGFRNTTGSNNSFFGRGAGVYNTGGSGIVAIGRGAGPRFGNDSTNLRLYIDVDLGLLVGNDNPLIYGEFDNDLVRVNGDFQVNHPDGSGNVFRVEEESGNVILNFGKLGIGIQPADYKLYVNGTAAKTSSGGWIVNSDARLKKDIEPLKSQDILNKILEMQGVTYQWNDTVTGYDRPEGVKFGFIAQDLEKIWPSKVSKDHNGFLQTSYGDYDPMFVEAIKALAQENEIIKEENLQLQKTNEEILTRLEALEKSLHDLSASKL